MTQYEAFDNEWLELIDEEPHPWKLFQNYEFTTRMETSALKHKGNLKPKDFDDLVSIFASATSKSLPLTKHESTNLYFVKNKHTDAIVHHNSDTSHFCWIEHEIKPSLALLKSKSANKSSDDLEAKVGSTKTAIKDEIRLLLRRLSLMHSTINNDFQEIHFDNIIDNKCSGLNNIEEIQVVNNNYIVTINDVEPAKEN